MPTTPKSKTQPKKEGFSDSEKAAMRARIKEIKAEERWRTNKAEGEKDVLAAIAEMAAKSRSMGERLHKIITETAPDLSPRTWYGMPAYANKEGKVVIFFRGEEKFKERYLTFGFNQEANLDDGTFWPIAYALTALNSPVEKEIARLVKKAVG